MYRLKLLKSFEVNLGVPKGTNIGETVGDRDDFKIEDSDIIEDNRGEIISSAIAMEGKIDNIISILFFDQRSDSDLFNEIFLSQEGVSLHTKERALSRLLEAKRVYDNDDDRKDLISKIRSIKEIRNRFAHGNIGFDRSGAYLVYYKKGLETQRLDDTYWKDVENKFNTMFKLLSELSGRIPNSKKNMDISQSIRQLREFLEPSLGDRLNGLEKAFVDTRKADWEQICTDQCIDLSLLLDSIRIKDVVGQINEIIHALGIVYTLPYILEDHEIVKSLSLGAGNTGKDFDLQTDRRIAEFKFIKWKGGSESTRQNSIFKDFFYLAEADDHWQRYLYVISRTEPLKFLEGGRALSSVASKNRKLADDLKKKYGSKYRTVREYYQDHKDKVIIEDLTKIVPQFSDF